MSRDEYMNRYRVLVTGLLPPTGNAEALHQRIIFIWPQARLSFFLFLYLFSPFSNLDNDLLLMHSPKFK